jgi:hypothetical protein
LTPVARWGENRVNCPKEIEMPRKKPAKKPATLEQRLRRLEKFVLPDDEGRFGLGNDTLLGNAEAMMRVHTEGLWEELIKAKDRITALEKQLRRAKRKAR